jgi:hypothetical protein
VKSNQKLWINNVNEKGFLMKLSHVTENGIPTGDEAAERVTKYLQSRKHLKAAPAAHVRNPGNNEYHREQDRSEQRRRDELSSIEESPDMPEPGDNIRTRKTKMEGKVKKVSGDIVLFQLVDGRMMKTSIGNVIVIEKLADEDDEIMEAGWKNAVAAGAMALGSLGSGGAHAGGVSLDHGQGFQPQDQVTLNQRVQQQQNRQDLSNYSTEYLQKAADPNRFGRFMVSVDNAKAELQDRENGKQQTVAAPTAEKQSSGYSTEYLQKAADPKRFGRFLISVEKAQELLDQMKESFELNEISDTVINKWQKEKLGPQMDAAKARGDTEEEDRVYGKIIKSTKHMGDNFERRAAQKVAAQQDVEEGKADYNFSIEDLKRLEQIRDLPTLKVQAMNLISKPSIKPMKPEKIEWFKNSLERMNSPTKVIKLMYDLLLSGEGNSVIGTRSSMKSNDYRQRFGEQGVDEEQINELDRETVKRYVPARINKAKELARTDFDKAERVTQQDLPRALGKLKDKSYGYAGKDILFYAKLSNGQKVYARIKDKEQLGDLQQQYADAECKMFDFNRPDIQKWLEARRINLRKFEPGMVQTMGNVTEGEEINNPADTVTVDVPLLIRIMEYAKEDAKTDLDLHNAAEKLIELSQEGRTLTMDDYATMIGDVNEGGMGGINRSAPSNDVSYQDVLDDSTDEWRGDTVKVKESIPYSVRLKTFLKDID